MVDSVDLYKKEFISFQNDLSSYLLRIVGDRDDSKDIAQETFYKSFKSIASFRGDSSFKTWVFSIATNLARDHHRMKKRWSPEAQNNASKDAQANPELIDKMVIIGEKSPAGKYEIVEHIDFCFTCMAKTLSIEQQVSVILKDIYEFKVIEIMQIMDLSEGKVKHAIADGRKILMDIFEKKCALVHKNGACYQCSELNGIFNPKQKEQEVLAKIKMVEESKNGKSRSALFKLRTLLVRNVDPLNSMGTDLHSYFLTLMPGYSDDTTGSGQKKMAANQ